MKVTSKKQIIRNWSEYNKPLKKEEEVFV